MAASLTVGFAPFAAPREGVLVVFCDDSLKLGPATRRVLGPAAALVARAAAADRFKGKSGSALVLIAPADLKVARLVVVGCGKASDIKRKDFVKLGGVAMGKVPSSAATATIVGELPNKALSPDQACELALGVRLRGYVFDRYKTKPKDGEEKPRAVKEFEIGATDASARAHAWTPKGGLADGVIFARDLVNEPANVLFPIEFARRVGALKRLGVGVDVLDVAAMKKLGMNALLGVGQGSRHDSRLVVMRWNGGKRDAPPVAFIGSRACASTPEGFRSSRPPTWRT